MTAIVTTEHLDELNSAINALKLDDVNTALDILQGVIKKSPNSPEALHLLGLCSVLLGDIGRGIELITNAHEIDGECRDYVDALATLKTKIGDLNSSLYFAKLATTLDQHPQLSDLTPMSLQDYAGALVNANVSSLYLDAQVHYARRFFAEAANVCEKELRLKPNSVDTLRLLGKSLIEIGEYPRAATAFHAAEQIAPGHAETLADLGYCLTMLGQSDDASACFEYARELDDEDLDATARNLVALSYMNDLYWPSRTHLDGIFLSRAKAMGIEIMEGGDTPAEGKIRIGILSNHFYNCDTGLLLETFLKNYNKRRFEVFCLQQSITHDKMTDRLKTMCDSWRAVFDLDDWVLASLISGDGIQALIDITGYAPGQRRATLSAHPAPLQVAWLNHIDGTGDQVIDLVLSDDTTVEIDRKTALTDQEVTKLESGLFAFDEFGLTDAAAPLPALEHDTVTFGAYADLARVNVDTAKIWSDILRAVPRSLLVLNVQPNLPAEVQSQLSKRFAHFGMSKRVAFLSCEPDTDDSTHQDPEFAFLNGVDVLLDGAMNSSPVQIARSLWMGVPVLTLSSTRRSGQTAASVLTSANKGEWIASTPAELVSIAQELTQDLQALAEIRKTLRDDVKDSALFQGRDLAREIETAIEMALEDRAII